MTRLTARGDVVDADIGAYLRRLGLDAEPPSAAALGRIHRAQVERVPYETVWIHMGEQWRIDPADSLRRVALGGRGGYCYQLNGALSELLVALGYQVTRHVGGVHGPSGPDSATMTNHLVLVVGDLPSDTNPTGCWYVDAGLGDGLHEPIPMLAGEYVQGPLRFVLSEVRDGLGDWHVEHDPTGSFTGMSFHDAPTGMEAFIARHEFLSTSPASSFAGTVTAQLRHATGTVILRGCVLARRDRDRTTTATFDHQDDWLTVLGDVFGIRLGASSTAIEALWARVASSHEVWLAAEVRPRSTAVS